MESAIPEELRGERTLSRRIADSYAPPYPAWVARFPSGVRRVVMAYFGVQSQTSVPPGATDFLDRQMALELGPGHVDRARFKDPAGYDNVVTVAYWSDPEIFDRWFAEFRPRWESPALGDDGLGYFAEIVRPGLERFETLFSTPGKMEGVSVLSASLSGEVQEHAYWGSARERIPLAQRDRLEARGRIGEHPVAATSRRVRIAPQENLCLIRSGQDWSETEGTERELYLRDVEPALRAGMDYLRDHGSSIGCYSCRYADIIDGGPESEKTFGLAYFRDLADMERWSESHRTHLEIFGRFMTSVQELNFNLKLRLYHEVTVARADEQYFEYVNCHPGTGLLAAATGSSAAHLAS